MAYCLDEHRQRAIAVHNVSNAHVAAPVKKTAGCPPKQVHAQRTARTCGKRLSMSGTTDGVLLHSETHIRLLLHSDTSLPLLPHRPDLADLVPKAEGGSRTALRARRRRGKEADAWRRGAGSGGNHLFALIVWPKFPRACPFDRQRQSGIGVCTEEVERPGCYLPWVGDAAPLGRRRRCKPQHRRKMSRRPPNRGGNLRSEGGFSLTCDFLAPPRQFDGHASRMLGHRAG